MTAPAHCAQSEITVYVVEDHDIVREALTAHLERQAGLAVLGATASIEDAVADAAALGPDVVLLDRQLGHGVDGLAHCRRLRWSAPGTRVIVLTAFGNGDVSADARRAGASGFVKKSSSTTLLVEAIRVVAAGGLHFDPSERCELSAQELGVLRKFSDGEDKHEIALRLCLSPHTVETYLKRATKKLGAATRREAVAIAIRSGLI